MTCYRVSKFLVHSFLSRGIGDLRFAGCWQRWKTVSNRNRCTFEANHQRNDVRTNVWISEQSMLSRLELNWTLSLKKWILKVSFGRQNKLWCQKKFSETGKITKEDFISYMRSPPVRRTTFRELETWFRRYDADGDGAITEGRHHSKI